MMDNLHIVQWNAARSTAATNYLLSTLINNPKPPQAILIQEPPWYQIGLEPSPTDPNGIPKMGVCYDLERFFGSQDPCRCRTS